METPKKGIIRRLFEAALANPDQPEPKPEPPPRIIYRVPGAGEVLINCSFANFRPTTDAHRQALNAALGNMTGFIVLMGPPGVGKSHLAHSWAKFWIQQQHGVGVWWAYARKLYEDQKAAYNSTITRMPMDLMRVTQKLVIDDFETPRGEDERECFKTLFMSRLEHERGTIVTTNMPLTEFRPTVGDAIWDRLKLPGNGIYGMSGDSQRGAQ